MNLYLFHLIFEFYFHLQKLIMNLHPAYLNGFPSNNNNKNIIEFILPNVIVTFVFKFKISIFFKFLIKLCFIISNLF